MNYTSPAALSEQQITVTELKQQLALFSLHQIELFHQGTLVSDLVLQRADYIDQLLHRLWDFFSFNDIADISLIAVGGYGRRELHPLSDIDILLLTKHQVTEQLSQKIIHFITLLWDLKLEIGHSVRSVSECINIGKQDLTVATNLQEARYLSGDRELAYQLKLSIHSDSFWPSADFYQAKLEEQQKRHHRFHDTTYNLEPDIKSSPGGLRDIHTLSWIARRHFGATSLLEMSQAGFLTDAEYRELLECQEFLWRARFALHIELKRYDNRLTFGHQASVAEHLGYIGEDNRGVELMMKQFYRTLRRVAELNSMLLKIFDEAIINQGIKTKAIIINDDFQRRGRLIEARKPALFQARPDSILDMFLLIANDSTIEGVSPATMRQLCTARRRLKRFLCEIPTARKKFLQLTQHPNALHSAFNSMHKLGVIAAYLPQWSQIVGQMQFDLFHAYTVDEHSMRLLKHIHKFANPNNRNNHPICCEIYPKIAKKELLIIAAIFHDIAKGRGGDHSELGAVDAYQFCVEHGLSKPDANLVSWLVKSHLLMSVTAQRRDIYDPDVIAEFAKHVRDEERLDYLLCLTVADICATNPELWNSWKRTLLADLYNATQRALRRGLENSPDLRDHIRHNQYMASAQLRSEGFTQWDIDNLWRRFKANYFLRHTNRQIAWHASHLLLHKDKEASLILISKNATRGGTEIFIYSKDQAHLFATVAAELDRRNITIYDAQIMASKDGYALDTFMVLDQNNEPLDDRKQQRLIEHLYAVELDAQAAHIKTRRPPRQLQHFTVKTRMEFLPTKTRKHTLMELVALDTPGLLAAVGATFAHLGVNLHAAKITTIGERAEDLFILTSELGGPLDEDKKAELQTALIKNIDNLIK